MEPKPKERIVFDEDSYYGDEGEEMAINDLMERDGLTEGEDGYSLSGEAKDATASRNGLSRNQMGIEEKAAECKEAATVLANDNAL